MSTISFDLPEIPEKVRGILKLVTIVLVLLLLAVTIFFSWIVAAKVLTVLGTITLIASCITVIFITTNLHFAGLEGLGYNLGGEDKAGNIMFCSLIAVVSGFTAAYTSIGIDNDEVELVEFIAFIVSGSIGFIFSSLIILGSCLSYQVITKVGNKFIKECKEKSNK